MLLTSCSPQNSHMTRNRPTHMPTAPRCRNPALCWQVCPTMSQSPTCMLRNGDGQALANAEILALHRCIVIELTHPLLDKQTRIPLQPEGSKLSKGSRVINCEIQFQSHRQGCNYGLFEKPGFRGKNTWIHFFGATSPKEKVLNPRK